MFYIYKLFICTRLSQDVHGVKLIQERTEVLARSQISTVTVFH